MINSINNQTQSASINNNNPINKSGITPTIDKRTEPMLSWAEQTKTPTSSLAKSSLTETVQTKTLTNTDSANNTSANTNKNKSSDSINKSMQIGIDRYVTILNKRKPTSPPTINNPDKMVKTISQNRFSILSDKYDKTINHNLAKPQKPPPIYLREKSSNELVKALATLLGKNEFYIVPLRKGTIDETKIQVTSENDYRVIISELEKANKQFYSYQLKSSKGITVVIKGIEAGLNTEEIKSALEEKKFSVRNIYNMVNREGVLQPLYKVELNFDGKKLRKGEIHPIYSLQYLLHRKISIEQPHKRREPVQCLNCNEFGHTKSYCKLTNVCVICSGIHPSAECPKNKEDPDAKVCSNCKGNHTANYRGCPVYQALKQKMIEAKQRRAPNFPTFDYSPQQFPEVSKHANTNIHQNHYDVQQATYANVVKQKISNTHSENLAQFTPTDSMQNTFTSFIQRMDKFMEWMQGMMQSMMQSMVQNQSLIAKLINNK